MIDKFKAMFSKPPKDTYILVKEGNFGVEMYVNEHITQFNKAYREQIISFLTGIVTMFEESKKK